MVSRLLNVRDSSNSLFLAAYSGICSQGDQSTVYAVDCLLFTFTFFAHCLGNIGIIVAELLRQSAQFYRANGRVAKIVQTEQSFITSLYWRESWISDYNTVPRRNFSICNRSV